MQFIPVKGGKMVTLRSKDASEFDFIVVKLEGKAVGNIQKVGGTPANPEGYRYVPKNSKSSGEVFTTVQGVKNSLLGDD